VEEEGRGEGTGVKMIEVHCIYMYENSTMKPPKTEKVGGDG
jgi:hypothetical protein